MNVNIDVRGGKVAWDPADIERLALHALRHMHVPENAEVSISLVGVDEIHELNEEYRGIDTPTDVLSFPCDDPFDPANMAQETIEVGDVVICTDVVDEQRGQFGTTFEQEASLMLVHSILHLLGYDHMEAGEREVMEGLEKEILDSYGLTGIR